MGDFGGACLSATRPATFTKIICIMGVGVTFDVEKQLGFYAQYHHQPANFWLHVIGVPLLLWSAVALVAPLYVAEVSPEIKEAAQSIGLNNFRINAGLIVLAFYAAGYILMEPFAGAIAATLMLYGGNCALEFREDYDQALLICIGLQIGCWAMQFFGHYVFEGRAPALFDNLFQSLYLAPLFVLLELLFLVGYRRELSKRIYENAERDIAAWKAKSK